MTSRGLEFACFFFAVVCQHTPFEQPGQVVSVVFLIHERSPRSNHAQDRGCGRDWQLAASDPYLYKQLASGDEVAWNGLAGGIKDQTSLDGYICRRNLMDWAATALHGRPTRMRRHIVGVACALGAAVHSDRTEAVRNVIGLYRTIGSHSFSDVHEKRAQVFALMPATTGVAVGAFSLFPSHLTAASCSPRTTSVYWNRHSRSPPSYRLPGRC